MSAARRIGHTDGAYERATELAIGKAGDGGVWHVVEVYDEGQFTVQSQPHDPVGVIYVVPEDELTDFTERHPGANQLDAYGHNEADDQD